MKIVFRWMALCIILSIPFSLVQAQLVARHNMSSAEYQTEFNKYTKQGMRLADVSGYSMNGKETYAAIWNKDAGPDWTARHAMSESGYQSAVNELKAKGYRPGRVSAFNVGGQVRFAAIFYKPKGAWVARHDLSSQQFQTEFNTHHGNGYRLVEVCGYSKGGAEKYAAVWEKSSGPQYIARHAMSSSKYQDEFDEQWKDGYRPVRISGFEVGGDARYAGIWEKINIGTYVRFGLDNQNYQAEWDNQWYQGGKIKQVSAYNVGGTPRFAAIWNGAGMSYSDISFIDEKAKKYMDDFDIPGLSLAVMKDGRLVFAKGYGKSNKSNGDMVSPNTLMRIASVSKPITAVAIMKLVEDKKLNLSDKVFGSGGILGNICNTNSACIDKADFEKITVQHCLEHTTGWTQDAVWKEYGLNNSEIIKWAAKNYAQPNTPGSQYQYMNFDYFLLARIIEKKTGQTYQNYVKNNILAKCGITKMRIGADTEAGRAANETIYYGGGSYDLKLTRMDGNGGWIARPIDLLQFMAGVDKLSNRAEVLKGATIDVMLTKSTATDAGSYAKGWIADGTAYMHNGCMPGNLATLKKFKNGVSIAVTINTRPAGDDCHWQGMYPMAEKIAESSIAWPAYNLF